MARDRDMSDDELDFIWMMIGKRGALTPEEAQRMGDAWREAVQRNPGAKFTISIDGFDDDPRELWQIPEAANYVRQWAAAADIDDAVTAQRFLEPRSFALLGLCGVFETPSQIH
jgi:hypothetical protein